jgi:hypothetical protein
MLHPYRITLAVVSTGAGTERLTSESVPANMTLYIDNISYRDDSNNLTDVEVGIIRPDTDYFIDSHGALTAGFVGQYNGHQITVKPYERIYVDFDGSNAGDVLQAVFEGWSETE